MTYQMIKWVWRETPTVFTGLMAYSNLAVDGNKYTVTSWFIKMDLFTLGGAIFVVLLGNIDTEPRSLQFSR